MQPILTIVIPTRDDPLIWATLNSLFAHHSMDLSEVVVIDNSPEGSAYAADLKKHVNANKQVRYLRYIGPESSCLYKEAGIREAQSHVVLCCDSHVLFPPGSIDAVRQHFAADPESRDLVMGPCMNSAQHIQGTNQLLYGDEPYPLPVLAQVHNGIVCRGNALGCWVTDPRGLDPTLPAFEIQQQGTGAFAMRREAWPGFHPAMTGFGGNETYLMEAIRKQAGKVLCLPAFRWVHSFYNPDGKPYATPLELRIRNYLVGFRALGRTVLYDATVQYFSSAAPVETQAAIARVEKEVNAVYDLRPFQGTEPQQAKNGFEARVNNLERRIAILEAGPVRPESRPETKQGVYEKFIVLWQKAGGDVGGSVPKPLFTMLCHLTSHLPKEDGTGQRPNRTLEFGCGLSTLAFDRQKTQHTSIEHDPRWIERVRSQLKGETVTLVHAPLQHNWYDWRTPYGTLYDLILLDGPPGNAPTDPGRRGAVEFIPSLLAPGGTILIDDTQRDAEKDISRLLAERLGLVRRTVEHGGRSFDVLTAPPAPLLPGLPGTELYDWLKVLPGMMSCQLCYNMALQMNQWGATGCRANMETIVEDMLPRARAWWKNSAPWMKAEAWFHSQASLWTALKSTVNPDGALRDSIRQHVLAAIERAEQAVSGVRDQ